ncbi:hypothetical protein ROHU_002476 [Labeo rohita]|uniref:Uncharacterized protein n=1 Tax=Labeo rohita TaxID=84645 RepID=A0A498NYI0_LABRO|nr:hypothetical protein ROHU_002476 [Labeo rohita]
MLTPDNMRGVPNLTTREHPASESQVLTHTMHHKDETPHRQRSSRPQILADGQGGQTRGFLETLVDSQGRAGEMNHGASRRSGPPADRKIGADSGTSSVSVTERLKGHRLQT